MVIPMFNHKIAGNYINISNKSHSLNISDEKRSGTIKSNKALQTLPAFFNLINPDHLIPS